MCDFFILQIINMNHLFNSSILLIFIPTIIICILFIPIISNNQDFIISNKDFIWPTPGYKTITCPFGPRKSPATGASTFHTGIDIGAPVGSEIHSICDGKVTYTGFKGADGFTIIIENSIYQIIYGHLDPNYIIKENQFIKQNELIAYVGPKYVYNIPNNPYHDNYGPTNGATTGPHLHITIKKDDELIDPSSILPI